MIAAVVNSTLGSVKPELHVASIIPHGCRKAAVSASIIAKTQTLKGQQCVAGGGTFALQLVCVPCDIERAIADASKLGMPELEEYSTELRTGRYRRATPA